MSHKGAPTFELTLNGTKLTADYLRHVQSIEFVESMDELDALTVQFLLPDVGFRDILALCEPGASFEVRLGYGSSTAREGYGDIIEVSHSIAPGSPWTVSLRGLDGLHRLKGTAHSKVWDVSHSSIVESIAKDHGFKVNVEGVEGSPTHTFQSNVDDAIFLRRLAKEHNYIVRVEKDTLRFGRRDLAYGDTVTVTWGEDLEKVSLRYSIDGFITEVTVKGRDYSQDTAIEGSATSSDLRKISGGVTGIELVQKAFGTKKKVIDHANYSQQSQAKDKAKSELQERAEKFLSGSLTCRGKPDAVSGGMVEIEGLPWPFSGKFLIKQTTHTLEPGLGYRTTIEFISDSLPPES